MTLIQVYEFGNSAVQQLVSAVPGDLLYGCLCGVGGSEEVRSGGWGALDCDPGEDFLR